MTGSSGEHVTWIRSDRRIPTRFVRPLLRFTAVESAGGIVLLAAVVAALLWANLPFAGDSYERFWETPVSLRAGALRLDETLRLLVNDGLMAVFFFVVGVEIKRELVTGDLRSPRAALLPALAALGGMVAPALIYLAFTAGTEATRGWGIPMATDIAFAVGVVSLLGRRVPLQGRLFLLALAIADDIGAIAVIAVFYRERVALEYLALAAGALLATWLASRVGIRSLAFYVPVAVAAWWLMMESGVHPTVAGVAVGLLTPARSMYPNRDYRDRAARILATYEADAAASYPEERIDEQALALSAIARESVAPAERVERALHPWSSFVVVPVFALANAGLSLDNLRLGEALTDPIALGVGVGLLVGKAVGITLFAWLGVRLGGVLPRGTGWRHVTGLAVVAGVGFTVSLFVTGLAFDDPAAADLAKTGIFAGSLLAGIAGYLVLRSAPPQELEE